MVNKIARITEVYVRHRRPTTKIKGTFRSRKDPYVDARMTLWAVTELGDTVWLDTRKGLDTRRIDTKVQEYESENQNKIGKVIEYALARRGNTYFLRRYVQDVE